MLSCIILSYLILDYIYYLMLERAKKAKQIEVRPDSGTWKELRLCEMIEMCKAPRRRNSVS